MLRHCSFLIFKYLLFQFQNLGLFMKLAGNLTVVKEFKTLFLTCICYFLLVLSSCLSHPCLHGGTCIDTYFLHNDMNAVDLYSSPSFVDSQQNAMAYICKCIAPFAGRNCEGNVLFSRKMRDHLVGVKSNLFCLKFSEHLWSFTLEKTEWEKVILYPQPTFHLLKSK